MEGIFTFKLLYIYIIFSFSSIIIYDITSRGSEAYLNLAKEIIMKERVKTTEDISIMDKVLNKNSKGSSIPSFDDYQL